jgi:hypothetical protein
VDTHEQLDLSGDAITVANDPLPIGASLPYLGRPDSQQLGLPLPMPGTLDLEV